MAETIQPIITTSGINAMALANGDTQSVLISHISLGTSAYTPNKSITRLKSERIRVTIDSFHKSSADTVQLKATVKPTSNIWINEIGFWCNNGHTLFAVYSKPQNSGEGLFLLNKDIKTTLSYALKVADFATKNVTVQVKTDVDMLANIINIHESKLDPHSQYVKKVDIATLSKKGVVQLTDTVNNLTTTAITPNAVQKANVIQDNNLNSFKTAVTNKHNGYDKLLSSLTKKYTALTAEDEALKREIEEFKLNVTSLKAKDIAIDRVNNTQTAQIKTLNNEVTGLKSEDGIIKTSIDTLSKKIASEQVTQNNNINARLLTATFNTSQSAQDTKINKNITDINNINQYNIAQDNTIATKANKSYVDDELSKKLNKTGDTATGRINFNGALGSNDIYSIGNSSIRMRADIACDFYANNQKMVYINQSKLGVICDLDFHNMMICSNINTNNYDGFWHDDTANTWYFQSDKPRKSKEELRSILRANDFKSDNGNSLAQAVQFKTLDNKINLNDLKELKHAGIYRQEFNRNTVGLNYPADYAGVLEVLPSAYTVLQRYTTYNTGEQWFRHTDNSRNFGSWTCITQKAVKRDGDTFSGSLTTTGDIKAHYIKAKSGNYEGTFASDEESTRIYNFNNKYNLRLKNNKSLHYGVSKDDLGDVIHCRDLKAQDLDTLKGVGNFGVYRQQQEIESLPTNIKNKYPSEIEGVLEVLPTAYGSLQRFTDIGGAEFKRFEVGNEWTPWDGRQLKGKFIKRLNQYSDLKAGQFIQLPKYWSVLIFHTSISPNATSLQLTDPSEGHKQFQVFYFRTTLEQSQLNKNTIYSRSYGNNGAETCYFHILHNEPTKLYTSNYVHGYAQDNTILIYAI